MKVTHKRFHWTICEEVEGLNTLVEETFPQTVEVFYTLEDTFPHKVDMSQPITLSFDNCELIIFNNETDLRTFCARANDTEGKRKMFDSVTVNIPDSSGIFLTLKVSPTGSIKAYVDSDCSCGVYISTEDAIEDLPIEEGYHITFMTLGEVYTAYIMSFSQTLCITHAE
jgi:hypothetical protein